MSKISDIIDQLHTIVSDTLTEYKEMSDAFILEDNSDLDLRLGYTILPLPANNTNRETGCRLSINRDFTITLTMRVFSTENNRTAVRTGIKDLLEDHFSLVKAIENDPSLEANAAKGLYISDEGIGIIAGERDGYLFLPILVGVEYFENLT